MVNYAQIFLAAILLASMAAAPATQPDSTSETARLHRGQQIRQVLLDALEQSYRNKGVWPDHLTIAPAQGIHLIYTKPDPSVNAGSKSGSVSRAASHASVTVVLHEPFEQNPAGVWVGYTDGHLEFAATPAELAACENQLSIIRNTSVAATTQPDPTTQPTITLKVLDPEGHPVAGALVGIWAEFGDVASQLPKVFFDAGEKPKPAITDDRGEVKLSAATAFASKFTDQPTVPLFILNEQRQLVAQVDMHRSDFAREQTREIRLSPACHVTGSLSSVGLMAAGKKVGWNNIIIFKPGEIRFYTLQCISKDKSRFDFLLPPGDYGLEAYGSNCDSVHHYIRITPGQRELNLQLDLPPDTITQLSGKPAPEFRNIKGWQNGKPVKLADLHGKIVLLDFWGYWCGPCVAGMPDLMNLYDKFKDKGLVIIAVHNDTADSIADMDQKLEKVRNEPWAGWNGRNLPFLIALDGGGPTRIQYTSSIVDGATTAAYGITGYPTALVIGRDGRVLDEFDARDPKAPENMEKLLSAK